MENTKTSEGRGTLELIVQLITAAAVFAGIYFVMIELRQGREISTVEMIHKRMITNIEHDSKIYGENISDTLAKACANTQALTGSEQTQLHYYFQNRMRLVLVVYSGAELGSFQDGIGSVQDWQFLSQTYVSDVLSYPVGERWLETDPFWGNEEFAEAEVVAWVQSLKGIPPNGSSCDHRKELVIPSVS